ncbi:MAG: hypothetical protein M1833_001026 [Piccolia ochrophora]|nr:MAG: hypothetical protein M1833_001026 [Piccolia ochrophora]
MRIFSGRRRKDCPTPEAAENVSNLKDPSHVSERPVQDQIQTTVTEDNANAQMRKLGKTAKLRRVGSKILSFLHLRKRNKTGGKYTNANERNIAIEIIQEAAANNDDLEKHDDVKVPNDAKSHDDVKSHVDVNVHDDGNAQDGVESHNRIESHDDVESNDRVESHDGVESHDDVKSHIDVNVQDGAESHNGADNHGEIEGCNDFKSYDEVNSRDVPKKGDGADGTDGASTPTASVMTFALPFRPKPSKRSHALSHQLSTAFFHPTVIHRPDQRKRPSLISYLKDSQATPQPYEKETSPVDTTDPSSYNTSGNDSLLRMNSTAMTSLLLGSSSQESNESENASQRSLVKSSSLSVLQGCNGGGGSLAISQGPVFILPTIVTIETTAAAKIFFETHFNGLFTGSAGPRTVRRRRLEQQLSSEPLTSEQRERARRQWVRRESEHLRQTRTLKVKTANVPSGLGISVAGYEVVKVLGKGSFGVVRLVRERRAASDRDRVESLPSKNTISTVPQKAATLVASGQRSVSVLKKPVFALKVIRKSDMLRNSQEGHIRAERDFLVAAEGSRWIVPLISAFQDSNNLYLLMEYMVGGDFLGLLIRKQTLSEEVTRWYIAEMILCIEEAHALKWIHRDIKPDNFLISSSGHLKISDFGLAFDGHWAHDQSYFNHHRYSLLDKFGLDVEGDALDRVEEEATAFTTTGQTPSMRNKGRHDLPDTSEDGNGRQENILSWRNRTGMRNMARSVVGTSQYMAPEVCLFGCTPFCMENRQDTKAKILQHATTLAFPAEIKASRKVTDLIKSLLQEKEPRLSSKKYSLNDFSLAKRGPGNIFAVPADKSARDYRGYYVYPNDAADIKAHPFFRGVPWKLMHAVRPPFVPRVKGWEDTKYFEEEEPVSDVDDRSSSRSGLGFPTLDGGFVRTKVADIESKVEAEGVGAGVGGVAAATGAVMAPVGREENALVVPRTRGEKRRPRDKILRDLEVGREALELRKLNAFLGYTYQAPNGGS